MSAELDPDFCPYRGLEPYTEEYQDYFVGRERDKKVIISNLYGMPLTIFYGVSGVGKSSVLLAGVAPKLRETENLAVVVFRDWQGDDFARALKNTILDAVNQRKVKEINPDPTDRLDQFLRKCNEAVNSPVFLILDQFEEYLLNHPPSKAEDGFDAQFARAVNRRDLGVHILLAVREEELSKLDRFRGRIPNYLGNLLRLSPLDRATAIQAIRQPLIVYNGRVAEDRRMEIEESLVEKIIEKARQQPLDASGGGQSPAQPPEELPIETPVLQLLLKRLWEEERNSGSHRLRLSTFEEKLGGAEHIIGDYLEEVLNTQLDEAQRETAAQVLRFLVTPSGTKTAHEPGDLAEWAKLEVDQVRSVLDALSLRPNTRILRKVSVPGQADRYEISHDVLAQAILRWVREREKEKAKQQAAQEAARRLEVDYLRVLNKKQTLINRLSILLIVVLVALIVVGALFVRDKIRSAAQRAELAEHSSKAISEIIPSIYYLLYKNHDFEKNLERSGEALKFFHDSGNRTGEGVTLASIGELHYLNHDYSKAQSSYEQALDILKKSLSPDHPFVATTLNKLAQVYLDQGKDTDAESLYKQAQAISEKVLGPESEQVTISLRGLGELLQRQRKYDDAERRFDQARQIHEKVLGRDHQQVAIDLTNLAGLFYEQGKYAKAEQSYERAKTILEKVLKPDDPALASVLVNLATVYSKEAKYDQAEPLFKRARDVHEKVFGNGHPQVATDWNNLGILYLQTGGYPEAESSFEQARTIRVNFYGDRHPEVAAVLDNLAFTKNKERKYGEAVPLYEKALEIFETDQKRDELRIARVYNNLAISYRDQGKYDEAESRFERALKIREKKLGPNHPDVAYTLNHLALLYYQQEKYGEAAPRFEQALSIYERTPEANPLDIAETLDTYPVLLRKLNREPEAAKVEDRVKALRQRYRK